MYIYTYIYMHTDIAKHIIMYMSLCIYILLADALAVLYDLYIHARMYLHVCVCACVRVP